MRIWVIDTETTTTCFEPVPDGHIVEVGLAVVDTDRRTVDGMLSMVVKADVRDDKEYWVFDHTSLTREMVRDGATPYHAENAVSSMLISQYVTSYNVAFDSIMIQRDLPTVRLSIRRWAPCIMRAVSRMPLVAHSGQEHISLEAAYKHLCKGDPAHIGGKVEHRAMSDAIVAGHVLLELIERGEYDVFDKEVIVWD